MGVSIEGFSRTRRKLQEFPLKIARKADRDAMRAGATILKRFAKNEAPFRGKGRSTRNRSGPQRRTTKSLRNRIGFRSMRRRPGEVAAFVIRSKAPHSVLVQLGTGDRYTESGAFRGRMDGNDFMRRALRKGQGAALAAIESRMRQAVAEAARGV